jgi:hypothetical protein
MAGETALGDSKKTEGPLEHAVDILLNNPCLNARPEKQSILKRVLFGEELCIAERVRLLLDSAANAKGWTPVDAYLLLGLEALISTRLDESAEIFRELPVALASRHGVAQGFALTLVSLLRTDRWASTRGKLDSPFFNGLPTALGTILRAYADNGANEVVLTACEDDTVSHFSQELRQYLDRRSFSASRVLLRSKEIMMPLVGLRTAQNPGAHKLINEVCHRCLSGLDSGVKIRVIAETLKANV